MTEEQKRKLEAQFKPNPPRNLKFEREMAQCEMDLKIGKKLRQLHEEDKALVPAERILKELFRIAFSNIKDYINVENGVVTMRNIEDISEEAAAAIAAIDIMRDGVRIKLHDKMNALTTLSKWAGLLRDLNLIQNNNLQIVIQDLTTEAMKSQKDMELFSLLNPDNGNGNGN